MNNKIIVAIDFDGTIVRAEDPTLINVTKDFVLLPHAKEVLDWMYQYFFCILWTCRDDVALQNALSFLSRNNIKFHAINQNAPFLDFQTSNKIYFDYSIDDRTSMNSIDWLVIRQYLQKKYLKTDEETIVDKVLIEVYPC